MQNRQVPHPNVVDKNLGGYLGSEESQHHTRPPAQGSSARKISSHNFWLQKPAGIELVEETLESQAVPLKQLAHRLTQTHSL